MNAKWTRHDNYHPMLVKAASEGFPIKLAAMLSILYLSR